MQYQVIHDRQRPLCFVGNTFHNHTLYEYFKTRRPCEQLTVEEVAGKNQEWFDQRQFMCAVTNIGFKKQVIDGLTNFNIHWFSVIGTNSVIGYQVTVGYNTFINNYNVVFDNTAIGNHCTITNYVQLSHGVIIGDFSHIGPYCYLCFTELQQGVCVGLRSSFPGKPNNTIVVADWCNFMMNSVVIDSIVTPGTYSGKRLQSNETSLEIKIL